MKNGLFRLLPPLCLLLLTLFGCGRNASLERNVDYVSDDILLQQEAALKENLQAAKRIYDQAARSGSAATLAQAEDQYRDYLDKYNIVIRELQDRFGKTKWTPAVSEIDENAASGGRSGKKAAPPPGAQAVPPQSPAAPEQPAVKEPDGPLSSDTPRATAPQKKSASAPVAPAKTETAVKPARAAAGDSYVVVAGDSLSSIASRCGVGVEALMRANGLNDPDRIAAGQTLTIPSGGTPDASAAAVGADSAAAAPRTAEPTGEGTYLVRKGDTLRLIAKRLGTTEATLMEKNGLTDPDKLREGRTLIVR